MLHAISNSLKYAVLITLLQNSLAIVFAVLLNKKAIMAKIAKSVFFLPAVLSILVVAICFSIL